MHARLLLARLARMMAMVTAAALALALFTPLLPVAGAPEPLVGTWVTLSPAASSTQDGLPQSRCDHTFVPLSGLAQRASEAVPFPSHQRPTTDPHADKILLFGGWNSDSQFADSWLLNVAVSPPVWSKIQYAVDESAVEPRFGVGVAFLPNGLDPVDTGLTAIYFSGYTTSEYGVYSKTVQTYNFASRQWRTVATIDASNGGGTPFPRAYIQWHFLPQGAGSGKVNDAIDSSTLLMFGGLGASDGNLGGNNDRDTNDQWLFNLTATAWTRFGEVECTSDQSKPRCSDETTLAAYLSSITPDPRVDLSAIVRPADIYAGVSTIVSSWQALGYNSNSLQNDPNACATTCSTWSPSMGSEGVRSVRLNGKLYEFGGYGCGENGVQKGGGDACFLGSMWILDYASMTWSELKPSQTDAAYWPSRRAYNTMVAHKERNLIIIHAGAYQDSSSVLYYYNDVYAFDALVNQFIPFKVGGQPPPISWSAGASLHGDDMFVFGGCQGSNFYNQLSVLRIGVTVQAENCYASGLGTTDAMAGQETSFTIQTRESQSVWNGALNRTETIWGANMTYGTNLEFSAQLVSVATDDVTLIQAKIVELGAGQYRATYTASTGTAFKLFIYLADELIPNAPFTVKLAPSTLVSPARTTPSGYGVTMAAKGKPSTALIQLRDSYGNRLVDSHQYMPADGAASGVYTTPAGDSLILEAAIGESPFALMPIATRVSNNGNGSFTLQYDAPDSASIFFLALRVNKADISGSPFRVENLSALVVPRGTVIAFIFLAVLNIVICFIASFLVHHHRDQPMMRSSSPNFLHLLIFGSMLSSSSVICLTHDSDDACRAFHSFLSIGLTMSLAALLAKSHRVERIFSIKVLKVPTKLSDAALMVPTSIVIAAMVLLNILWIAINPLHSQAIPVSDAAHSAVLTFQQCKGENGAEWTIAMFACVGVILIYGVYLAVQTGHVPEQFNESKIIAASIYNLFIICIIVVPLQYFIGSSSDFLNGRIVIQCLAILWCSIFNVLALIGPKALLLYGRGSHLSGNHEFHSGGGTTQGTGGRKASTAKGASAYATRDPNNPHSHFDGVELEEVGASAGPKSSMNPNSSLGGGGVSMTPLDLSSAQRPPNKAIPRVVFPPATSPRSPRNQQQQSSVSQLGAVSLNRGPYSPSNPSPAAHVRRGSAEMITPKAQQAKPAVPQKTRRAAPPTGSLSSTTQRPGLTPSRVPIRTGLAPIVTGEGTTDAAAPPTGSNPAFIPTPSPADVSNAGVPSPAPSPTGSDSAASQGESASPTRPAGEAQGATPAMPAPSPSHQSRPDPQPTASLQPILPLL